MGNIKLLPENLVNQIAAGEVVERPASVIKELVENSLDAGATRLIIEVEGAGDSFIRITDDGCGMDTDDAKMAFERHATSKINTTDDLFNIHTLGFRGEALASIASVSYMTLQSKKKEALSGNLVVVEGGKMKMVKDIGCPEGTQIEVKQLFYNTPARKKYLKNDPTEFGHILDTVTGIALAYPYVAFKLVHDNKVVFELPATEDLITRIRGLLGRNIADELIPVFYGHSKMQLSGFIGKPLISRANKKSQYLFVNQRQVNSHVLSYAVRQSFHSLLAKDKFPVFLLFLNIAPELVDVNVHPRKSEVKFANEKEIFSIFITSCKKSLEKNVLSPNFAYEDNGLMRQHQGLKEAEASIQPDTNAAPTSQLQITTEENKVYSVVYQPMELNEKTAEGELTASTRCEREEFFSEGLAGPARQKNSEPIKKDQLHPLAQLDNSYILCEQNGALVIMDQHAAHERIRYTEILQDFEKRTKSIQPLLTPINMELSHQEAAVLNDNKDILDELGFEIEYFGGNTFTVFAVPSYFVKHDIAAVIMGLIDDLNNQAVKGDLQAKKEKALTYAACRSAVKFGDPLSKEEQENLCKRLLELDLPYTCPHGRPTTFKITPEELRKRFGRTP